MMTNEEPSAWAESVNIVFPNQDDRGTAMYAELNHEYPVNTRLIRGYRDLRW